MTKKSKSTKSTAKKSKPEQMKIAGTGRLDAIPEIEAAAEALRELRGQRMELGEQEAEAEADLNNVLIKLKIDEYKYEGADGKRYRAYIPTQSKARVQRIKDPKAPKAA